MVIFKGWPWKVFCACVGDGSDVHPENELAYHALFAFDRNICISNVVECVLRNKYDRELLISNNLLQWGESRNFERKGERSPNDLTPKAQVPRGVGILPQKIFDFEYLLHGIFHNLSTFLRHMFTWKLRNNILNTFFLFVHNKKSELPSTNMEDKKAVMPWPDKNFSWLACKPLFYVFTCIPLSNIIQSCFTWIRVYKRHVNCSRNTSQGLHKTFWLELKKRVGATQNPMTDFITQSDNNWSIQTKRLLLGVRPI